MKKFRSNDEEKNGIFSGDLIRLMQTEYSNGFLCADLNYNGDFPEGYIRKYQGTYETERISVETIWRVEIIQESEEGFGKTCRIEKNNEPIKYKLINFYYRFKFKSIIFHNSNRLRHYLTGKLLGFKELKLDSTNYKVIVLLDPKEKNENVISFFSTIVNQSNLLQDNQSYLLKMSKIFFSHILHILK